MLKLHVLRLLSVIFMVSFIWNPFLSFTTEVQTDLLERLRALPDVEVTEIAPQGDFLRTFQIDITQPVDHQNPDGQQFKQRLYLSHKDELAPMVFHPSGYSVSARSIQEIAGIYHVNHLGVTHRYMAESRPQPVDWQYLTIEQAAADHHRIVNTFKQIYNGIWISTGRSKSGQAALFHRRFYPDDVKGTVVLGAPIIFSTTDSRFDQFLEETAGDEKSRTKISQFQRAVLENRGSILPLVRSHLDRLGYGYSIGEDVILEFAVLEYPFYFWAFGSGVDTDIPHTSAPAEELLDHLLEIISLYEYTDDGNDYFKPVYYQLYTELGYYKLNTDHLEDLLTAVSDPTHQIFAPNSNSITFKPEVMQDVNAWLQTLGNDIIYIYGGQDTWTAAAVELTGQTNAIKIVQPGANHFIKIVDLDERQTVYETLDQWLNPTGIEADADLTKDFMMYPNYPNPFNAETSIGFELSHPSQVSMKIFNIQGILVRSLLIKNTLTTGFHSLVWDGRDENGGAVSSGEYFIKIEADRSSLTRKILLLR